MKKIFIKSVYFVFFASFIVLFFSCATAPKGKNASGHGKNARYQMMTKNEELYYLDSKIKYPSFEELPDLSKRISNTVEYNWKNFKSFCKDEWDYMNQINSVDGKNSRLPPFEYITDSEVTYSGQYVCVYLETYIFNGGAHGNVTIQTFCYDTQNHVFKNINEVTGYSYQELSEACKKALVNKLITQDKSLTQVQKDSFMEMINTGIFPQASNFEKFTLEDKTVNIYFEPYTVAPYSYGIQVVSFKF